VRPETLLVVADGPRHEHPGDADLCVATRAIIDRVDWNCTVLTNYASNNLGCKNRVSTGLSWVFDTVDEAIILEDDCVPDQSFFRFCEELLGKYRHDQRIAQVSGANFQFGRARSQYSYYFSRYNHVWGWASWRRAWKRYDVSMKLWPEIREGGWLCDWLGDMRAVRYWTRIFDKVHQGQIDTWDYQWTFACWTSGCLSILPAVNLVSNVGFNNEATHTRWQNEFANMLREVVRLPLRHPPHMIRDSIADSRTEKNMFSGRSILKRVAERLKRSLT
jgi:hypothetical protein